MDFVDGRGWVFFVGEWLPGRWIIFHRIPNGLTKHTLGCPVFPTRDAAEKMLADLADQYGLRTVGDKEEEAAHEVGG